MTDTILLDSQLSADQEVQGGGNPNASGTSRLSLNASGDALNYELNVSGLDFGQFIGDGTAQTADESDDVTRIHLHSAPRGANGGVAFGLIDLVAPQFNGQDNDDLQIQQNADGSVTLTGSWELSDPATLSLREFVDGIRDAGSAADVPLYWNVHSNGSPGGAIRGQLQNNDPINVTIDGLQTETVTLGKNDSLNVNSGGQLRVDGTAVAVERDATNVNVIVNNGAAVAGSFNGIHVSNGGIAEANITNRGTISSDSRAINLGGNRNHLSNSGNILGTGNPRDGVIYGDQTANAINIENRRGGLIDVGAGNQGDAISLELGANVTGSIYNAGRIQGRGASSAATNSESSAIRLYWGNQTGEPISTLKGNIVNTGKLLAEAGSGILIESQTVLNGEIRNSGLIQGDFRGINFANGGTSSGTVINQRGGVIQSDSRAINIGGNNITIDNAGRIRTLDNPSDGVIYGDQTATSFTINNQRSGRIDVGAGNQGDAISLELGENVTGSIYNAGVIAGRGAVSDNTNSQSSAIRLYWGNQTGEPVSVFQGNIENARSGRLTSEQGATILIEDQTQLDGQIINQGLIRGGTYDAGRLAIDARNAEGSVNLLNGGRIQGDVLLSVGNDVFDNTHGRTNGNVLGGDGNDILRGGRRGDNLFGEAGDDILSGGRGRNILEGGIGSDTLFAGRGRDTFVFGGDIFTDAAHDTDVIRGFGRSDTLDLDGYAAAGGTVKSFSLGHTDDGLSLNIGLSSGDAVSVTGNIFSAFQQARQYT
ncbi:CHRD domain-containing protein [filamentous cyanobacterium LEGE 11480]|uniref:CHRD domain-containing protein n=1 Tax=Romeriopsis navalis LEGE 11480 TaxID=2777977 RepID=A0A928VTE8_9CYAN|nr:CHRD domain-containing protein [Romeriopsis navalis]MBE9031904.1 CHRD domain-containing protein [Romeriopsis navalis LEGE 11480]